MFCVYVLKSKKDDSLYIGYTENLERRLIEHNSAKSFATKNKIPLEVIYCEFYKSKSDAKHRERSLKRFAQAYSQLKKRIQNSIK